MESMIDQYLKKHSNVLKTKIADMMINAAVIFCAVYTIVYLFLEAQPPAIFEGGVGAVILLFKLMLPTQYYKLRIFVPLFLTYILIFLQTFLFFGGQYGFQYLFFAHIATVIALYFDKNIKKNIGVGLYIAVTIAVIYKLERFNAPLIPIQFSKTIITQFRLISIMAFMGVMIYLLGVFVVEQTRAEERLKYLSIYDDRFEVLNYTTMIKLGEALFETDEHFVLFLTDTDYFKSINDTYGHGCGDSVLKSLSDRLKEMDGPRVIARYGGSTFAVIALTSETKSITERIEAFLKERASHPVTIGTRVSIHTTISVGLVSRHKEIQNFSGMLSRADEALYLAKAKGGNQMMVIGR